ANFATVPIHASKRQTMDSDIGSCQLLYCFSDIHRITTKAIKFGDDQYITIFHAVKQAEKPWSLTSSNRTTYMFFYESLGSDIKTRSLNFPSLILSGLFQSGYPAISKNT
ncbi:hypothetical protein VK95_05475, partial [Leclercia sp. LK8]